MKIILVGMALFLVLIIFKLIQIVSNTKKENNKILTPLEITTKYNKGNILKKVVKDKISSIKEESEELTSIKNDFELLVLNFKSKTRSAKVKKIKSIDYDIEIKLYNKSIMNINSRLLKMDK